MTTQTDLWKGPFGDLYQERNAPTEKEVEARYKIWDTIIRSAYSHTGYFPNSILEVGAGQGPNLMALEKLSLDISKPIKLYATEVNEKARLKLQENVKSVEILHDIPKMELADLVYTYGVMIHTHPAHIKGLQQQMFDASKRYICCMEYFAPETRPVVYRGEKDALWLDDYGSKWLDNFPLRILSYGFLWKKTTGLDNVTFWLFEKTRKMI